MELVVALMVGGILAAVAVSGFGEVQGRMAARSARATFLSYHAQARALAVERGTLISLQVNPTSGIVSVREGCDGTGEVLESRDFGESFSVTVDTGGEVLRLCMTPKGVANPNLNTFGNQGTVAFVRGSDSESILLLPLGQVVTP